MATDPDHTAFCPRCGYDLYGLDESANCPECGLGRRLCDWCGGNLGTTPRDADCPHCRKSTTELTEWQLRLALLMPWRPGPSAVWTTAHRPLTLPQRSLPIIVSVASLAIGLFASATAIQWRSHSVAWRPTGGYYWSWRVDLNVSHWEAIWHQYTWSTGSVLYTATGGHEMRSQALDLGQRPEAPADSVVKTYHDERWLRWPDFRLADFGRSRSTAILVVFVAPAVIALFVAIVLPAVGLRTAMTPGASLQYLRPGLRRLAWTLVAGVFCQGLLLVILSAWDLGTLVTRWPFVGTRALPFEWFLPVLVHQLLLFRAISFDRARVVFPFRNRARRQVAGGILLTLLIVWGLPAGIETLRRL